MTPIAITLVAVSLLAAIARFVIGEQGIGQMDKAFAALRTGGIDAARAVIDKAIKVPCPNRFAALALIGDRVTLAREVAALDGPLHKVGYFRTAGLCALAYAGDAAAAKQCSDAATAYTAKGVRGIKPIKDAATGLARIAAVIAGENSATLVTLRPDTYVFSAPWLKAMLWDACARAFERDGRADLAANARQRLALLDKARAAKAA